LLCELQPQLSFVVTHTGALPLQAVEFVEEHCTQAPRSQAGAPLVGQANAAPDPKSPLHGTQVLVPPSQIGLAAGHSALVVQPHSPVDVLHVGLVPVHKLELVVEHCRQAPDDWQAGFAGVEHARVELVP
jgi:hypothetical protein